MYPGENSWRMSDAVLEKYIFDYIHSQPVAEINFAWQGGEPTLLGVDFFRKAIALQQKFAGGKIIANAIQTNGTLLDDEWCEFLAANKFLVGLSVDGPRELHDQYRVDKRQQPTFDKVMRGLEFLKQHRVEFNTLTVVNRANSQQPLEVYRFLKSIGSEFLQFIPLVERAAPAAMKTAGFDFAAPPLPGERKNVSHVTEWSVEAEQYGNFLCAIFDEWVRNDVGKRFVQLFDTALGNWLGLGSSLCVFAEKCGAALAIEHNGDLYSCDHYVYPEYRLGNIMDKALDSQVLSGTQLKFGYAKSETLPTYCRQCAYLTDCWGECPKNRIIRTTTGEHGLNYLCRGFKQFFAHAIPEVDRIVARLKQQPLKPRARM